MSIRRRISMRATPAVGLVLEWWTLHQTELAENWHLLAEGKEPKKIDPLE